MIKLRLFSNFPNGKNFLSYHQFGRQNLKYKNKIYFYSYLKKFKKNKQKKDTFERSIKRRVDPFIKGCKKVLLEDIHSRRTRRYVQWLDYDEPRN